MDNHFFNYANGPFTKTKDHLFFCHTACKKSIANTNNQLVNIITLNTVEINAVSGGFDVNGLLLVAGGIVGAISATFLLVGNRIQVEKNFMEYCSPCLLTRLATTFTVANLKIATGIFLRVSAFSLLFSSIGYLAEYFLSTDKEKNKL